MNATHRRISRTHKKKRMVLRRMVDAICNLHWHGRELAETTKDLIELAYRGGVDYLGPMPNTKKPLLTAQSVIEYLEGAKRLVQPRRVIGFLPIVMLTEHTPREELVVCVQAGIKDGKIYPYLRTTKSEHGIQQWGKMIQVVRWCEELGIKVHVHFEHPDPVYIDREAEYMCLPICQIFLETTTAVIIWEHGSDGRCIPMWKKFAKTGRFFLTLTAHHLAWNEDEVNGDVRRRCKPYIRPEPDRNALVHLVYENHRWVMLGADDAAHPMDAKHVHEGKCACGDFTSPFLHLLCAHALDRLLQTKKGVATYNNFVSRNARKLHKLPPASRKILLVRKPYQIQPSYKVGSWTVESAGAGEALMWSFVE